MHHPSFDTWTIIFLLGAFQGLFVAAILVSGKKEKRSNKIPLALLVFLFSVTLIEYVLYWTHYIQLYPHMISVSAPFPFLFGVLLYYYLKGVFESGKIRMKELVHLIPFLLCIILFTPIYFSSTEVKKEWLLGNMIAPSLFHWPWNIMKQNAVLPWLMIVHMSAYSFFIYKKFHAISRTNHEVKRWFNWLSRLFILFIVSFASYYILVRFSFFNSTWDYMISFAMMTFIFFIAWFGYVQPRIFSGFTLTESIPYQERYKNSILNKEISNEILVKLEAAMQSEKMYRNNDLRLEKLAHVLQVSKHHLSQVINEQTGMSFFDYINQHRIDEAKELLSSTSKKELNIIDVAYEVGFNNKVSFNTAFKKIIGKTPTEFRNQKFAEQKSN